MAGTGHSYEIANIADVRLLVEECAGAAEDTVLAAWFRGKPFLRYATSDRFVFKIRKNASRSFLEAVDERERDFIVRKLDAGQDVRLFSRDQFGRFGPDVRHAVDWVNTLRRAKPSEHAKISRMGPEDFFRKVSVWIPPRGAGTKLPDGKMSLVLSTEDGHHWYELEDAAALLAEGDAMSHCVDNGTYGEHLERGELRILSMRSGEGDRLLTIELRGGPSRGQPWHIRQIQAFANGPAPQAALGSICDLLNHLHVAPLQSREERRARIAHSPEHGWQSIYKTWQRIDFLDMDCISDGNDFIVMSPIHPERPLLNVSSPITGAFRPLLADARAIPDGNYSAALADTRHFSIEELRVAAAVINAFGADYGHSASAFAGREKVIPFVDSLVAEETEGHVFLRSRQTGNAYVTSETDKAMILLEIGKEPRFATKEQNYSRMPAWVCNVHRWKNADARRCLAAMTALKCDHFATPAAEMRPISQQFEPIRTVDGDWRSFTLEASRRETRKPGIHWMETDFQLAYYSGGRRLADFPICGSKLRQLPYTWPIGGIDLKEIASRLNSLRITPANDIVVSKLGRRLAMKRGADEQIVCIAGRWKTVRSQHDLVRMVGKPDDLTPGEAAVILQALPDDPTARLNEANILYLACLAIRLSAVQPAHVHMPWRDERKPLVWLFENLSHLSPRQRKNAIRHASILLDQWTKGPRDIGVRQDEHVAIFFAVWQDLPKGILNRVIRHVFRKCSYWLGHHGSDIQWIRAIYPSLENQKMKDAMYRGIQHGAYAASTTCPDVLLVNAVCLQVYARLSNLILLDHKVETIRRTYQKLMDCGIADDKKSVMAEVAELIETVPDIVEERRLEAERVRLEWEKKFKWASNLADDRAVA
jgi:hypothetical protein